MKTKIKLNWKTMHKAQQQKQQKRNLIIVIN